MVLSIADIIWPVTAIAKMRYRHRPRRTRDSLRTRLTDRRESLLLFREVHFDLCAENAR
jgi:hypothetical protein